MSKHKRLRFTKKKLEKLSKVGKETASVYFLQDAVVLLAEDLQRARAALEEIQTKVQDVPESYAQREYSIRKITRTLLGKPK